MRVEVVEIKPEDIRLTLEHLKNEGYDYFSFLTAVDYRDHILLVWWLVNTKKKSAVMVESGVKPDAPVASVADLWKGAEWHEREVYDLFGVVFEGNPELKRILLSDDFEGHPLRKDFTADDTEKRPEGFV